MPARRGWRERVEPGLYRAHRVACPRSADHRAGGRCPCPYELSVPGTAPGSTRTITHHGTVVEARAERRRLLSLGRPEPARLRETETLAGFAAYYMRARAPVLAPNTVRARDYDYRTQIHPYLGDLLLTEVTRVEVEAWLGDLIGRARSRRAVVESVATLRVILSAAVEWGRLPANPAKGLRLPAADPDGQAVERVLDRAQLVRLIAAAGSTRTETIIRAAGEAGLRRGEISGLRWSDVDLPRRRLHVRRQVVQLRREGDQPMRKIEQPTKGRRARKVAISAAFAERLADWYAESVVEAGSAAAGYVWPGRNGTDPMHDRSAFRAVERACIRAGLAEQRGLDKKGRPLWRAHIGLHSLRHTAASVMLVSGVPLLIVSRQLGHASLDVTARVYAHLVDDAALDVAAAAFTTEPDRDTLGDSAEQTRETA